ncbi:MAG: sulfatase-like hydrolase/transferase [Candidatus Kapabacteria bacterium]|nr:sulfatase-like hydrolase/transferase [Candidatus Kapabacteria bacterium]
MSKYILPFLLLVLSCTAVAQENVILIIADDLGTDYCGFYENHLDTVKMPNIRRLLERGVRFTNAWSNPLCSPTRAGILTGRYSFRTGVGNAVGGTTSAVLDTAEITIPRLLTTYSGSTIAKGHIGKWHLQLPSPKSNYVFPNVMGYDHYEGNFQGVLNSYTNWTKVTDGVESKITTYATTETVNNAVTWVKSVKNKPFFMWLAFNAPHIPFHLPPANLHSYSQLSGSDSDIAANPKPYFKATVEALDKEIGRLFDTLQTLNKWENTTIIFIGDNGNDANVSQVKGGAKGSVYQEGINVPFIISGPSVVAPNRVSSALVNTHDLFATILELFGYTTWQKAIPVNKPVDSKSIVPILKNQSTEIRDWVFSEVFKVPTVASDGKTMRNKEYKLIDLDNGTQKFYNLQVDPGEDNDLLKGKLSSTEQINYNYLCSQMSVLVGTGSFCDINTTVDEPTLQSFNISPNPVADVLHILHGTPNSTYNIYSVLGECVRTTTETSVDMRSLPPGIYTVVALPSYNTMVFCK